MYFSNHVLRAGLLLAPLFFYSYVDLSATAEKGRVLVLHSGEALPTEEVLAGFQKHLSEQGVHVHLDIHSLEEDGSFTDATKNGEAPLLVLALGSRAAQTALDTVSDVPIVTGLVLSDDDIRGHPNAAGVVLEFPLETQFQWVHRMMPAATNIGVLYNPKENQQKVDTAQKIAQREGLQLILRPVTSPRELPGALESLTNEVDALWGLPDRLVLSPQTAKNILLFSFRNRIPFIGLSTSWVKAGALYALHWDYNDLGAQCGELAIRSMHGTPLSGLPPSPPRTVRYSLNLRTADRMKLKIPDDLARRAHQIYD